MARPAKPYDKRRKRALYISNEDTIAWIWLRMKGMVKDKYVIQRMAGLSEHEPNRHGLSVEDVVCGAPGMVVNGHKLDCYLAVNMVTGVIMARFPSQVNWFVSSRLISEVREQIYDRVETHVEAHARENIAQYKRTSKEAKEIT